jgi:hypothetical protein
VFNVLYFSVTCNHYNRCSIPRNIKN